MEKDINVSELNESIKELTKAVRELTAAIKSGKDEKKPAKTEADMCKAADFVEQVYSGVYEIGTIKKAMQKRNILDADGNLNPYHPDCISWMIKEGEIYGDPDAVNNLILDMLAED